MSSRDSATQKRARTIPERLEIHYSDSWRPEETIGVEATFLKACRANDVETVRRIIKFRDVNGIRPNYKGDTFLVEAVQANAIGVVPLLLDPTLKHRSLPSAMEGRVFVYAILKEAPLDLKSERGLVAAFLKAGGQNFAMMNIGWNNGIVFKLAFAKRHYILLEHFFSDMRLYKSWDFIYTWLTSSEANLADEEVIRKVVPPHMQLSVIQSVSHKAREFDVIAHWFLPSFFRCIPGRISMKHALRKFFRSERNGTTRPFQELEIAAELSQRIYDSITNVTEETQEAAREITRFYSKMVALTLEGGYRNPTNMQLVQDSTVYLAKLANRMSRARSGA